MPILGLRISPPPTFDPLFAGPAVTKGRGEPVRTRVASRESSPPERARTRREGFRYPSLRALRMLAIVGIDGRRQLALTAYCLRSFFDAYLKGASVPRLNVASPLYPEIQVVQ